MDNTWEIIDNIDENNIKSINMEIDEKNILDNKECSDIKGNNDDIKNKPLSENKNDYNFRLSPQFSSSESDNENDNENELESVPDDNPDESTYLLNNETIVSTTNYKIKKSNYYNNIIRTLFVSCMIILGGISIYICRERIFNQN